MSAEHMPGMPTPETTEAPVALKVDDIPADSAPKAVELTEEQEKAKKKFIKNLRRFDYSCSTNCYSTKEYGYEVIAELQVLPEEVVLSPDVQSAAREILSIAMRVTDNFKFIFAMIEKLRLSEEIKQSMIREAIDKQVF